MKASNMNFSKILGLTALGVSLAGAAVAANGSWTPIYVDNNNGVFVSSISSTVSASTPPLPLKFPGSRVAMSVSSVSGTAMVASFWATLGGPIGVSTSVTGVSGSVTVPATITNSVTTITTNNSYHDVGMTVSSSVGQLWVGRAVEIRQQPQ